MYKEIWKYSENLLIRKLLILTLSFHRLLRSSPLGHEYSDPSVFSMILSLDVFKYECFKHLLRFYLNLVNGVKRNSIRIWFWGTEKVTWSEIRRIKWVGNHCRVFGSQKLPNNEHCMNGCIVVLVSKMKFQLKGLLTLLRRIQAESCAGGA